ncbi:MAG: hypothetical protein M3321_09780 [Actinomycetota bacterium]|nr:hypothetical protein [Actinomycetota bacterium]
MKDRLRNARGRLSVAAATALAFAVGVAAAAGEGSQLDPAHNLALPCEFLSTPGAVPRSAHDLVHVANVCGFVGTDIEFQSRTDATGKVHDYAFVGTMGAGTRIFDVTDPSHPTIAGGYVDPGWQNDVHVRGDTLVVAFDWLLVGAHVSECLKQKQAQTGSFDEGGVDVVRLQFDPQTATFRTSLAGCYLSGIAGGGAHTVTIHPSGQWLSLNTAFAGIEVVDLRGPEPALVRRIPNAVADEAHDVSFSADGTRLYSAGINSTRVVDVTDVFNRPATLVGTVPNAASAAQGADGQTIQISHQSDTSADGKLLVVTDEAGGGLSETRCNQGPSGKIGAAHFWAIGEIAGVAKSAGATESAPRKVGTWLYPNPGLAVDALDPILAARGRTERGCTIHVFRNGGNGSAGPGPIQAGFDGVSRLPADELVTAHYGAGVWHVDFGGPPVSNDGTPEDPRTTWGNTLGWNVMPGADTWSAKEYKGHVYAGDMVRGFDVYRFADCDGLECIVRPAPNTPGKASGGGQVPGELAELSILRGTAAGGRASFGFGVEFANGLLTGSLSFTDHASKKKVESTAIDSYTQAGNKATFTGRATVNGTPGVGFFVEVEDLGEPGGADAFRIVLQDGYGAGGVLLKGNVQVHGGLGL